MYKFEIFCLEFMKGKRERVLCFLEFGVEVVCEVDVIVV